MENGTVSRRVSSAWRWRGLRLSRTGIVLGLLFFAASLTPSLLPRPAWMQGALSGVSFAAGYLVGVIAQTLWSYLRIPDPSERVRGTVWALCGGAALLVALVALWRLAAWQNDVRALMDVAAVRPAYRLFVLAVALVVFAVLLGVARLFRIAVLTVQHRLKPHLPRPVARLVGLALTAALFWSLINGVLFEATLRAMDSSFEELDKQIAPDLSQPADPNKTGSAASLVDWELMGFRGREFIASGPGADEIGAFFGVPAQEPLRIYAGLGSAADVDARADLAFREMLRQGAFERSVLVVVVPTGTGWIDPAALDTLEYLHRGDVASVAVQYSYLSSWLSLMVEPGYGAEAGRALFRRVYEHWTALPRDARPRLYLHGLSLGAMNSEISADLYDVVADPFQGALWSGPPFSSRVWRQATNERVTGSPAWLPRFRDGTIIRFANQNTGLEAGGDRWGPIRLGYLQYASDPVTFFEPSAAWRRPAWLAGPRGPDVSESLRWFPVVTMLQLGFDMAIATTAPIGHGHVYAPEDYIDAWIAITQPPPLAQAERERLKALHKEKLADEPPEH